MLPYVMGETNGSALDTGQIEQVIGRYISPAAAVNLRLNPNHDCNSSSFNPPAIGGILCEY
jgi:hypothetical protein